MEPLLLVSVTPLKGGLPVERPDFLSAFARGLAWTPLSTLAWSWIEPNVFVARWKPGRSLANPLDEVTRDIGAAAETAVVHEKVDVEFVARVASPDGVVQTQVTDAQFFLRSRADYGREVAVPPGVKVVFDAGLIFVWANDNGYGAPGAIYGPYDATRGEQVANEMRAWLTSDLAARRKQGAVVKPHTRLDFDRLHNNRAGQHGLLPSTRFEHPEGDLAADVQDAFNQNYIQLARVPAAVRRVDPGSFEARCNGTGLRVTFAVPVGVGPRSLVGLTESPARQLWQVVLGR